MIMINLDVMLSKRKISSLELAQRIGITPANLCVLKTGKAKAIRFSTLEAICRELQCQPGDVLEYGEGNLEAMEQFYRALNGGEDPPKADRKLPPQERFYKAIEDSVELVEGMDDKPEEKWSDELQGG